MWKNVKFQKYKESQSWKEGAIIRKVIFYKAVYKGVTFYRRNQVRSGLGTNEWVSINEEFSFDLKTWVDDSIEIYREIKKKS